MLCITLPAIGLAKLDPPQDLGATPIPGRAAIRLDWKDRATGESRYVIQRIPVGTAGTESWERIELEPDSEGYVDQSVSFESPAFVYRVFAESGLEKSPSAEVSACHPKPDANELIVNGHMECIEHPGDSRSRPIGWEMGPTGPIIGLRGRPHPVSGRKQTRGLRGLAPGSCSGWNKRLRKAT